MRTLLLLAALLACGLAMAQAYKWVDENGVVHYSDTPVEGAEQILLPETSGRRQSSFSTPTPTPAAEAEPPAPPVVFRYENLEIVAPAPEETLWNIEGTLNVALRVSPALRQEDTVRVYFDGEMQEVNGTSFQIDEVWRGVHNIQAEIVDSSGQMMARSLPNRFYVQQNTIAN